MSVQEFIPIIWSDSIFMNYSEDMVFGPLMNSQYEGEIKDKGNKVKIVEIGDMTAGDYTGADITFSDVDSAAKYLEITESKYIAKQVDDVDAVQVNVPLMDAITRKMGEGLGRVMDQFMAAMVSEAGVTISGTTDSPTSITSANITTVFAQAGQELDEANAPEEGRVAVVPAWMAKKITLAKVTKDTDNSEALSTGYVGYYMGFEVYKSNNVSHSGTSWYKPMFFLRNNTIAFANQLSKVVAGPLEKSFAEGVKALVVYGGKVVRPSTLITIVCSEGTES